MTDEQKAAYIFAQASCALIQAMGAFSENMQRNRLGQSVAYDENAFQGIIQEYGIHHNATIGLFHELP